MGVAFRNRAGRSVVSLESMGEDAPKDTIASRVETNLNSFSAYSRSNKIRNINKGLKCRTFLLTHTKLPEFECLNIVSKRFAIGKYYVLHAA